MRLSTKSRFAVTAMIDLALRQDRGPVSLSAISTRHQISLSYLEQLFSKLRQQKLVDSTRGPGGGYRLALAAEKITIADIVLAVDNPSHADPEASDGDAQAWMSSDLWMGLNAKMIAHMRSVTLRQLALNELARGVRIEEAPVAVKRGIFAKPKTGLPLKVSAPNSVFSLAGAWIPKQT